MAEIKSTNKERVYNLTVELNEFKKQKRASNKGFAEEIKRVQAEIDELIEAEEEKTAVVKVDE